MPSVYFSSIVLAVCKNALRFFHKTPSRPEEKNSVREFEIVTICRSLVLPMKNFHDHSPRLFFTVLFGLLYFLIFKSKNEIDTRNRTS